MKPASAKSDLPAWITVNKDGCTIAVKVVPRASRDEIAAIENDYLRIRLKAPPVDGKANAALEKFLAATFDVPSRNVAVVGGTTSRQKRVSIHGITPARVCEIVLQ